MLMEMVLLLENKRESVFMERKTREIDTAEKTAECPIDHTTDDNHWNHI